MLRDTLVPELNLRESEPSASLLSEETELRDPVPPET